MAPTENAGRPPAGELSALAEAAAMAGPAAIESAAAIGDVRIEHKTGHHDLVTTADRAPRRTSWRYCGRRDPMTPS